MKTPKFPDALSKAHARRVAGGAAVMHPPTHIQMIPKPDKVQVITIRPDGSVVGLDHKRKGFNLRKLGKADIRRVTLIEWDEEEQAWEVMYQKPLDSGAGHVQPVRWGQEIAKRYGVDVAKLNGKPCEHTDMLHFDDYEDAVAFEVAVIQAAQLAGDTDKIFG
jgi:hypothetical protein